MTNNKGNQEFNWRENDESSLTLLKYDLEADHWVRAFKSAERKHATAPIGETIGVIGLVLSLVFNLIVLIVLLLNKLINYLKT
ncbi:hypothetical protein SAMN03097699_0593 [Flavobacteriaceae bacterium MAR_2010_188]|nr:hypothetical protein SAMN03097699_0593 [Flavobacteriaceae bacterium MAR_2010_188]